jgi:hypothetical protein
MKKQVLLAAILPALIAAVAYFPIDNKEAAPFHSEAEMEFFRQKITQNSHESGHFPPNFLPIDSNVLFPTAKTCGGCHGHDPLMRASITSSGVDVNVYDDWRSTMMGNAAIDPLWRAKVRQEILVNPAHSIALQDKCTACHAPAGHYQAKLKAHSPHFLLSDVYSDTLALDGVTCQICHAQANEKLGDLHSGNLNFDTNHIRIATGPYEQVFLQPMRDFVGITPMFGDQVFDAGLCAGCHTLITETADLNGQHTGGTFIEQATYHEWRLRRSA